MRRYLRFWIRGALEARKLARARVRRAGRHVVHSVSRMRSRGRRMRQLTALGLERVANEAAALNPFYRPEGELRACPACGSGALKPLGVLERRRRDASNEPTLASGCRACGLAFANPLPSAAALAAFYAEHGEFAEDLERRGLAGVKKEATGSDHPPRRHFSDQERYKLQLLFEPVREYLDVLAPPPGARVLDYGCGPGRLLNRLQVIGWNTYGIEPAIKTAFSRHQELQAPPDEPTFQLVTLHHVLEHLANPLDVLKDVSRAMVEGGILYISVPRLDALPLHRDLNYCLNPQAHIVSFTRDCLVTLLHMAGLVAVTTPESNLLDGLLTEGQPRRMRIFARKPFLSEPDAPPLPRQPLRAAESALDQYYGRASLRAPVRLRASRLRSERQRELLAHRWKRALAAW